MSGTFPDDVKVVSRTEPRDFMEVGSFIFVSSKAKRILEDHFTPAEFFPIALVYKSQKYTGWYYLHLLKELDCLDPERTRRAGREPPLPEMIKHMALIDTACEGVAMFRIAETPDIGISDELASALQAAKCSGVVLQKPDEWRNCALAYE
jgi:hypothetical protein